jgi:hypothetical protein
VLLCDQLFDPYRRSNSLHHSIFCFFRYESTLSAKSSILSGFIMENFKYGRPAPILAGLVVASITTLGLSAVSIAPAIATTSGKHHPHSGKYHPKAAKPAHSGKFPRSPGSAKSWDPRIAPIQSTPHGKTYSQWSAAWWQWALQTEASINPLLDKGSCRSGQSGNVWFLGGTLGGDNQAITRECTIPPNKSLYFPLINYFYGAFLNDPPEQRTVEYVRASVACQPATQLKVEIDGVAVANPAQYFVKSPVFKVKLPVDNVFGLKEGVGPNQALKLILSPSVDQGYYLFLKPLKPGRHTIRWEATIACPSEANAATFNEFKQNNTYHITVSQ